MKASLLLLLAGAATATINWNELPANFPGGTGAGQEMGYCPHSNELVVFGGQGANTDVHIMNLEPSALTWRTVSTNPNAPWPLRRFSFTSGILANQTAGTCKFIIFAGQSGSDLWLNDVWEFDMATETWRELQPEGPVPVRRYGLVGGIHGTLLYASHGFHQKPVRRVDDTWVLDLAGAPLRWRQVSSNAGRPFSRCLGTGAVGPDGTMVLYGGCGSGGYGRCAGSDSWTFSYDATNSIARGMWAQGAYHCKEGALFAGMTSLPAFPNLFVHYGGLPGIEFTGQAGGVISLFDAAAGDWAIVIPTCTSNCPPRGARWPSFATDTSDSFSPVYYYSLGRVWDIQYAVTNNITGNPVRRGGWTVVDNHQHNICDGVTTDIRFIHGILMALSWGFLLPIGISASRWRAHLHGEWFKIHRFCNSLGWLLQCVGFGYALTINDAAKYLSNPHAFLGITVFALGVQQPINAFFRPHIHEDQEKTTIRKVWEVWHKGMGYSAAIMGIINPFWGYLYLAGDRNEGQDNQISDSMGLRIHTAWVAFLVTVWILLYAVELGLIGGDKDKDDKAKLEKEKEMKSMTEETKKGETKEETKKEETKEETKKEETKKEETKKEETEEEHV